MGVENVGGVVGIDLLSVFEFRNRFDLDSFCWGTGNDLPFQLIRKMESLT